MRDLKSIEKVLKATANRRRLAILKLLSVRKQAAVGDIAEAIKLSFKSTSRHLSVLYAADLVEKEQSSTNVFYRLAAPVPAVLKTLLDIL